MAKPGSRKTGEDSMVAFVLEQLAGLGSVRSKSMFGGYGVYKGDVFFAIVDEGRLYFRVDDTTRPNFLARGMKPFMPAPKMEMKAYYEVPLDVLEDSAELVRWAREACAAKQAAGTAKKRATKKPAAKRAGSPARARRPR